MQVRGPTVPGNVDGTFVRNGAAHKRRRKRGRAHAEGEEAV